MSVKSIPCRVMLEGVDFFVISVLFIFATLERLSIKFLNEVL